MVSESVAHFSLDAHGCKSDWHRHILQAETEFRGYIAAKNQEELADGNILKEVVEVRRAYLLVRVVLCNLLFRTLARGVGVCHLYNPPMAVDRPATEKPAYPQEARADKGKRGPSLCIR